MTAVVGVEKTKTFALTFASQVIFRVSFLGFQAFCVPSGHHTLGAHGVKSQFRILLTIPSSEKLDMGFAIELRLEEQLDYWLAMVPAVQRF